MKKHHYVYHSYEEWGRGYIGVRSCNCLPEEDTKYFGSFCDKTFFPTEKTILFVCETRKEASEIEIKLHDFFDVAVNPKFANRAKATSTGFDRTGVTSTEAQNKAHSERMSGENNPNYGVPRTKEWKKAHSERMSGEKHPMFGVPHTEEWKQAMSERMSGEKNPQFGVPHTEETKKKLSEALSGENNPNYGVPLTEKTKKKISEALSGEKHPQYGRTGVLSARSKAIIAIKPDGTQLHYGSTHQATRELGIDRGTLCYLLKNGHVSIRGKWKGWQFIYKNSTNF